MVELESINMVSLGETGGTRGTVLIKEHLCALTDEMIVMMMMMMITMLILL